jgi:serine/threonine protein kinase
MSETDGISQEVSAIWRDMLGDSAEDDPTVTLLPLDLAQDAAETEAIRPPRKVSARQQRVTTPRPPSVELGDATRTYHEFNRRYRLNRVIGEGGMGSVYLARQHALARDVAVKVIPSDETGEMRKKLLFRAEALVTAYLEHPNIIPVYDAADHCLVMKRVRGDTMEEVIERDRSRAAIARHIEILIKVCDAIRFAHSRGIIHRDIKARNVMVGDYGEVLVLDWGLALSIAPGDDGEYHGPRLDRCPHVCAGTPGCLPPEIARGDRDGVGMHSDLFMLGALLYHILAGDLPFHSSSSMQSLLKAAANRYAPLDRSDPRLPGRLIVACERAMASQPEDRGTVDELAAQLRSWLLTAGHEEAALSEAAVGRSLMEEASRLSDAGDRAAAWGCRVEAAQHLERAISLQPGLASISSLQEACVQALEEDPPAVSPSPRPWWRRWW